MSGSLSLRRGTDRDGYWQLRANAGRDAYTGNYRQITRGFRGSKAAARKALAALVVEVQAEERNGSPSMPLSVLLERFLADRRQRGREASTLAHYEQQARHIGKVLGSVPIGKLTAEDLDGFYQSLTDRGLTPSTVARYHALVRAAFNMAVQRRWVAHNPAPGTARPTPRRPTLRVPTPAEVRTLLEMASAPHEKSRETGMFLRLAVDTWARRGELVALRRSHIDLERAEVLVETSVNALAAVKDTKTHSRRLVSIGAATCEALTDYWDWQDKRAAEGGVQMASDPFLFSDQLSGGDPWHPDTATAGFERVRKRAELTGVRLHDLRHFGPTQALQAGASIVAVSHRLGHAKVSTTLDVYAAWIPASDQHLSTLMGELLEVPPAIDP